MTKTSKKYLFDIKTSVEAIQDQHLKGIASLDDFSNSPTVIRAVERELEIIGEAATRLRQVRVLLTQTDSLINRRNTIIHQYGTVQPRSVWNFVTYKLPELYEEVSKLLQTD